MSLAFYDDDLMQWVTEPGIFTLFLGAASNDIRLTRQIEWAGDAGSNARFSIHTKIGDLLDNAETKAVLARFLGVYMGTSQIDALRHQPLNKLSPYVPHLLTPKKLQKIDAELTLIV